jgi:hypothetical protein
VVTNREELHAGVYVKICDWRNFGELLYANVVLNDTLHAKVHDLATQLYN